MAILVDNPVSILNNILPYNVPYTDASSLEIFHNIAAKNINAYYDGSNLPVDLSLGASGDARIEALGSIKLFTPAAGSIEYYRTEVIGLETYATKILDISQTNNKTIIYGGSNTISISGGDAQKTTEVGDLTLRSFNEIQWIGTAQSNIFFVDPLVCTSNVNIMGATTMNDAYVGGNLLALGNFYGQNMNLIKTGTSNDLADQIGYAFRINTSNQLELIKYSNFSNVEGNTSVLKKVAVFGTTAIQETDVSDVSNYLVFDEFNGAMSVTNENVNSSQLRNKYMWRFNSNGDMYANGFVGVNIENPQSDIHVAGTITCDQVDANLISSFGVETKSDFRLKDDYGLLSSEYCLQKVNELIPVKYAFKDKPDVVKSGFFAQQVRSCISEAVNVHPSGDLPDCHYVDQSVMIAYLVGAVKELSLKLANIQI